MLFSFETTRKNEIIEMDLRNIMLWIFFHGKIREIKLQMQILWNCFHEKCVVKLSPVMQVSFLDNVFTEKKCFKVCIHCVIFCETKSCNLHFTTIVVEW